MKRTFGEDGATLVLALVVVVIAAVLSMAVANLTTTSVSFSNISASDRQVSYAADGAADWAINQAVQALNASQPLPCSSPEQFLDFKTTTLTVRCETPPEGDGEGTGGSSGSQATYIFTVIDPITRLTYVSATVGFMPGDDGQLHASVQSWVDRPTT